MILKIASLLLALAGPGQLLENPEAQAKFAEAQQAFADEDYDTAAAAVEAAYLIEPEPMLLLAWAQAERNRDNCAAAVDLYQQFLDSDPPEQAAAAATENRDRCQEELDAAAEEELDEDDEADIVDEVLEEEPEPPPPTPVEQDEEPKAKAWYKDPVGGVLVGLGVVGVGVGAGLLGVGSSAASGAADQDSHMDYLGERDRATGLRNGGAVALSIGGALVIGGVVRYVIVAKKNKQDAAAWRVSPQVQRRLVGVTFGRRF